MSQFHSYILYIINNDGEHFLFPISASTDYQAKRSAIRRLNIKNYGPVRDSDEQVRLVNVNADETCKLSEIKDLEPGRLQAYEVLTDECARDLDSEVGEKIVIVDENWKDPTKGDTRLQLFYWTGTTFTRAYAEAFKHWVGKNGLKIISS